MKHTDAYSDEFLNAYIDDQLDEAERSSLLTELKVNDELSRRVCQLRKARDMVQLAYLDIDSDTPSEERHRLHWNQPRATFAIGLLLIVSVMAGWFSHARFADEAGLLEIAEQIQTHNGIGANDSWHVVLHVTTDDAFRLQTVLDETEALLHTSQQAGRLVTVELLANGKGVQLLRGDTSPYRQKIAQMQREFTGLSFLACQKTMQRLQMEKGLTVTLLPEAKPVPSALGQIIKRQQDGWAYIRI